MKKLLFLMVAIAMSQFVIAQDCEELFISEYVEGSGNNKAIEIYNPTSEAIDLADYKLVRYSNGSLSPNPVELIGTIESESAFVVVLDKRDPNGTGLEQPVDPALEEKADLFLCPVYEINKMMYFNGNDAVTLEKISGDIVDIFAKAGPPDTDNGWTNMTDTTITWNNAGVPEDYTIVDYGVGPLFWLSWTKDHTLIRKATIKQGVTENPEAFNVAMEWDSIPKNSFENLGTHECDCAGASIADNAQLINIRFFPNPVTNGELYINSEEKMEAVEIISTLGNTILRENCDGKLSYTLQTETLTRGVYFVKVTVQNDKKLVKKIIIE